MRGEHHRTSLFWQFPDQIPEVVGGRWIQAARGLIQQQNRRLLDERACNAEPLVHSAGEFHDQRIRSFHQTGALQGGLNPFRARGSWNIIQGSEEVEVLPRRKPREERPFVGNRKSNLLANLIGPSARVGSFH